MNKRVLTTRRLCRTGIIAALYVALTYAFMPFAFGPVQVRPAEALCILPLFFPEAIFALCIGCALSNLVSPFLFYDVFIGSFTTLAAAVCTFFIGKIIKKDSLKILIGGIFPVLFNAIVIPFLIVFLYEGGANADGVLIAYFSSFFSIFLSQAVWVYALGTPLYFCVKKFQKNGVRFFTS